MWIYIQLQRSMTDLENENIRSKFQEIWHLQGIFFTIFETKKVVFGTFSKLFFVFVHKRPTSGYISSYKGCQITTKIDISSQILTFKRGDLEHFQVKKIRILDYF